jgi:hypothetical protein
VYKTDNNITIISVAGPKLWDDLPLEIRTITSLCVSKAKLKTHLFSVLFN